MVLDDAKADFTKLADVNLLMLLAEGYQVSFWAAPMPNTPRSFVYCRVGKREDRDGKPGVTSALGLGEAWQIALLAAQRQLETEEQGNAITNRRRDP